MGDVFDRLLRQSVTARQGRAARTVETARQAEEERWQRRLAAECRIVTSDAPDDLCQTVAIPCLSASSLHRKRPRAPARTQSALNTTRRRPVSTVLSQDGSVAATQYYVVTDSTEPPPFHVAKVQTPRRLKTPRKRETRGIVDPEPLRREIESNRPRPILWENNQRVIADKMPAAESRGATSNGEKSKIIQVDFNNPISTGQRVAPTQMISTTGLQWENSGYPNSLSFILK